MPSPKPNSSTANASSATSRSRSSKPASTKASTKAKPTGRQVALITGASSGIGEILAGCFAGRGYDVILVARSAGKLSALADELHCTYAIATHVLPADLGQAGSAQTLAAAISKKKLAVDVLVNCAGVLEYGAFTAMPPAKHQQMIDLNISGLTALMNAFIPGMVARGSGKVLNVASIAAFQPIPMLATYAATKAYVLSLGEALAEELRGTGVTVTTLCPGITATNMLTQAAQGNPTLARIPGFLIGDAHDVALLGFEACMAGKAICVPGAVNQLTTLASRASPKWLVRRMGGLFGRNAA